MPFLGHVSPQNVRKMSQTISSATSITSNFINTKGNGELCHHGRMKCLESNKRHVQRVNLCVCVCVCVCVWLQGGGKKRVRKYTQHAECL